MNPKEEVKQGIKSKIKELKNLLENLKRTKKLQDALILQKKSVEFSHFSRDVFDTYYIDTVALKYRCDAVLSAIGEVTAKISREWYDDAIYSHYDRFMRKIDHSNDILMSGLSVQLMQKFHGDLTGKVKQICYLYVDETVLQRILPEHKQVLDMFIEDGCETLKSLYTDFENALLKGVN